MAGEQTTNGRVTLREVYDLLERRDERINRRLDVISDKLDGLIETKTIADNNRCEIDKLRSRSNIIDGINALVALVGAAIAAALGRAP